MSEQLHNTLKNYGYGNISQNIIEKITRISTNDVIIKEIYRLIDGVILSDKRALGNNKKKSSDSILSKVTRKYLSNTFLNSEKNNFTKSFIDYNIRDGISEVVGIINPK
ncbi:MAG: hypothetical protein KGL95_09565, partial [Patescibacteria group bacterium]|nr:hypothetical protein [Patescibacteria group bacterium]